MDNPKIIVTTVPFGDPDSTPRQQLTNLNVHYNMSGYALHKTENLLLFLRDTKPDIIIAGTEKYTAQVLDAIPNLKMISRVGIGVDAVDLDECKKRGIIVTNTPDAPSNAVAEMVIGQMINALRHLPMVDAAMRSCNWTRYIGREIRDIEIGIIGMGRIGNLIAKKLSGMKPRRIFINDIIREKCDNIERCEYATKNQILCECDIVTIHIPYCQRNHHFIGRNELNLLKKDATIINTSRGGIINEDDLYQWLLVNNDGCAAIDTFVTEPYTGPLCGLKNCLLTPHLGSCSRHSRRDMEVGAVEEVLNYIAGRDYNSRIV